MTHPGYEPGVCTSCQSAEEHLWIAQHAIAMLKWNEDDKKHPDRRRGIMREAEIHLLAVLAINSFPRGGVHGEPEVLP